MRILTWNVRQGGASRLAGIADAVASIDPEICVVTEYRSNPSKDIGAMLASNGLYHVLHSNPPRAVNGVLIASRDPLQRVDVKPSSALSNHWVCGRVESSGVVVGGVYLPGRKTGKKVDLWR